MKLTKAIREEVIEKAVKATFAKKREAHEKRRTALADALYSHQFEAAAKTARKLPQGWCDFRSTMSIVHPDYNRWHDNKSKAASQLKLSKPQPFPAHGEREIAVGIDHPEYDHATEVADAEVALNKAESELRQKLTMLLFSVTTAEKLKAAWPKGTKYLPEESRVAMLPVPVDLPKQIDELMAA